MKIISRILTNLQFSASNVTKYSIFDIEYQYLYFDVVQGFWQEVKKSFCIFLSL